MKKLNKTNRKPLTLAASTIKVLAESEQSLVLRAPGGMQPISGPHD